MSVKIGIMDSGLGGLSVLHRAMELYPGAEYLYYADRAHVPYGEKTPETLLGYVRESLLFLQAQGARAIVIACNTATSVAAARLRQELTLPIIGMEPAVKLALDLCPTGRILAAATPVTVEGEKLHALLERWDGAHRADLLALPELVRLAERGKFAGEEVEGYLRRCLAPYDLGQYCAFVLGCTHFNFFKDTLRRLLPPGIRLLDGIEGTVHRLAACVSLPEGGEAPPPRFYDSGIPMDAAALEEIRVCLRRLDAMAAIA